MPKNRLIIWAALVIAGELLLVFHFSGKLDKARKQVSLGEVELLKMKELSAYVVRTNDSSGSAGRPNSEAFGGFLESLKKNREATLEFSTDDMERVFRLIEAVEGSLENKGLKALDILAGPAGNTVVIRARMR